MNDSIEVPNRTKWDSRRIGPLWTEILRHRPTTHNDRQSSEDWLEGKAKIKRWFRSVYSDEIGLGLQLRWNLAFEAIENGP